jgi:hypothetical protein
MKEYVLPKRMVEAPEKRLRPQTIIVDVGDKMLSIVFTNDQHVQVKDVDVMDLVDLAMEKAASCKDLETATIEDVLDDQA